MKTEAAHSSIILLFFYYLVGLLCRLIEPVLPGQTLIADTVRFYKITMLYL
jgi:hypothetical protein